MRGRRGFLSSVATGAGLLAAAGRGALGQEAAAAEEFDSPYNFVQVGREGSVLRFRYALRQGFSLSAIDLDRPAFQVLPYTRRYFAAELARPDPGRVLMAGLGAGAFHRLFAAAHPGVRLVTVEIDPMIVDLARDRAGFRPGPADEVAIGDARVHLRRSREAYDWLLLDTYNREAQVPVHLTTREFYATVAARLAPGGVAMVNLIQGTRLFASGVLTLREVFPDVVLLPVTGSDNVVVMASPGPAGGLRRHLAAPPPDGGRARLYLDSGVDLGQLARSAVHEEAYLPLLKPSGVVLTDDYAPAESLDREPAPRVAPAGA